MMPQSINKYKIYLYLLFFIFLSSIFNFKFLGNYQDKFSLNKIIINGLSKNEKKLIEIELNELKNINIFKLKNETVLNKLNKFDFLEDISIKKIIPSSIIVNLSKTSILGQTLIDGKKFYLGDNGKFINSFQLTEIKNTATVFGKFKIEEYLNLIKLLKKHNLDTKNIEKFYFYKNKRWDLFFNNNKILMLPSSNVENSIKIYKKLLKNNNITNVRIIDLRVSNQIILTN